MQLINKMMLPMFGRVTLEKNKKYGKLTAGLESKHIGIGTSETWHGTPDFRIGCVCMLSTGVADEYNFDDTGTSKSYVEHCSPYSRPSVSSPSSPSLCHLDNLDRQKNNPVGCRLEEAQDAKNRRAKKKRCLEALSYCLFDFFAVKKTTKS